MKNKGFSILETTVSVFLLSIVMFFIAGMLPSVLRASSNAENFHIASGEAVKILNIVCENAVPNNFFSSNTKIPNYSNIDEALNSSEKFSLGFNIFQKSSEDMNSGTFNFHSDTSDILFKYIITYRKVKSEYDIDSMPFFLADISVDLFWDENNLIEPNFKSSKKIKRLGYSRRVLKYKGAEDSI